MRVERHMGQLVWWWIIGLGLYSSNMIRPNTILINDYILCASKAHILYWSGIITVDEVIAIIFLYDNFSSYVYNYFRKGKYQATSTIKLKGVGIFVWPNDHVGHGRALLERIPANVCSDVMPGRWMEVSSNRIFLIVCPSRSSQTAATEPSSAMTSSQPASRHRRQLISTGHTLGRNARANEECWVRAGRYHNAHGLPLGLTLPFTHRTCWILPQPCVFTLHSSEVTDSGWRVSYRWFK